ncbi:DUF3576 domain-containing protein [Limibaculum sp. M0105]|uniref:DUF3576 domain-containing protein n=1 Tax=Thermohalobaculum xanthum TaxID=2753746 RepID=A0A8J7MAD0_9RHOB|nr:DUF3576 domain-containing protein [Thermohalobaculum xanthum]MBK0400537.1 DUF3576 domain-containing protein [Thermohalobaculum xanthum]
MSLVAAGGLLLAGCGAGSGELAAEEPTGPRSGPQREFDPDRDDSIFGEGGFSIGTLNEVFGGGESDRKGAIPVNKFLWQASLDTLSFLPLASTDPFTGVIATDWGMTPEAEGERFKVTAYLLNTELSASSLKVAVYRERLNESGVWAPAEVNPETARKLEDAILTRARQLRLASDGTTTTG